MVQFSFLSQWETVDEKVRKMAQEAWTTLWGMPLSVALGFMPNTWNYSVGNWDIVTRHSP